MFKDLLTDLRINQIGTESKEKGIHQYIIETDNVEIYGVWFSKLDKSDYLDIIENNQIVTEDNSSIFYKTVDKPTFLINLIADFNSDTYKIVINSIKDSENE